MKVAKVTAKTKFKAVDLLKAAGFAWSPLAPAGATKPYYQWKRDKMVIACQDDQLWTIDEFHLRIRNQAAHQTRKSIKEKMATIDFGNDGYTAHL